MWAVCFYASGGFLFSQGVFLNPSFGNHPCLIHFIYSFKAYSLGTYYLLKLNIGLAVRVSAWVAIYL